MSPEVWVVIAACGLTIVVVVGVGLWVKFWPCRRKTSASLARRLERHHADNTSIKSHNFHERVEEYRHEHDLHRAQQSKKRRKQKLHMGGSPFGSNRSATHTTQEADAEPTHDALRDSPEPQIDTPSSDSLSAAASRGAAMIDVPPNNISGCVLYSLRLDSDSDLMVVCVLRAKELALPRGQCYVQIEVLPDMVTFTTKRACDTNNPEFTEIFQHRFQQKDISMTKVMFAVFSSTATQTDCIDRKIGSFIVSLADMPSNTTVDGCGYLKKDDDESTQTEICLCLSYCLNTETLTLEIMSARNLRSGAKLMLVFMVAGHVLTKRISNPKQCQSSAFGETFQFQITETHLQYVRLELTLIDKRTGPTGSITLGPEATGPALDQWSDMLAHPSHCCVRWQAFNGSDVTCDAPPEGLQHSSITSGESTTSTQFSMTTDEDEERTTEKFPNLRSEGKTASAHDVSRQTDQYHRKLIAQRRLRET